MLVDPALSFGPFHQLGDWSTLTSLQAVTPSLSVGVEGFRVFCAPRHLALAPLVEPITLATADQVHSLPVPNPLGIPKAVGGVEALLGTSKIAPGGRVFDLPPPATLVGPSRLSPVQPSVAVGGPEPPYWLVFRVGFRV